ncbi:Dolichyldiphosphatase 1 [Frankliniella fusca]|uniref:Dolichyldiphosphatase n=1 Tax=Frankliniella fusca TaxID=407009 RepID=A0AAE1HDJ7_9NEOP|nr:Dolichyldiphosphatase 1 [Frankliniella fusca]
MAAPGNSQLHSHIPKPDNLNWKPLSLTLVEYPEGDVIGQLLALVSLTPFAILAGFITLMLFRRDLHTIAFFLGVIFNEALNFVLKNWICEPRPLVRQVTYQEYGMPSSHSQFMWFFTFYFSLFVILRLTHTNNYSHMEWLWKGLLLLGTNTLSTLVTISRVYLQYHTWSQVIGGALVGGTLGVSWFIFVNCFLSPYFPTVASWKLCELLLIRDSSLIPNVLWFEYTNIRQEARARSRKLVSMKSQ